MLERDGHLWVVSKGSPHSAQFWGMVASFGALWGAMEITLGSFLHALRLPFGGTFLAAISAALLVAQRQVLPKRGLSLSTGVVAAICKSISPGGVIFGPMIGITVEALLVEIALLVAPRSRIGAAVAGALAVLWSTSQKIITQYVYYGGDLITLFITLMERMAHLIGISATGGWQFVASLVLVICLCGALVALGGHNVGRSVVERLAERKTGP